MFLKIDLHEKPKFSHVDDFSGHQYYTFMGYTVELYFHVEKRISPVKDRVYEITIVSIENIYQTEGDGVPEGWLEFETPQVAWSTFNGHIIHSFELWDKSRENDFKDLFCWIKYALENPVQFKHEKI
jgi:hypothetical protein